VLSVVCGAATATMIFVGWLAVPLPLAAIYFGRNALDQIERLPEEYTGQRLAKIGIGLGAGLGILLSGWLIFSDNEVHPGYQRLNWADLEPDPNKKTELIPPSALELSDKKTKVYVRGYILPGRRVVQLSDFFICRTSDQCRFSSQMGYRPTDLIRIKLTGDLTIDYTTHEVGVGGIFQADDKNPHSPYCIEGYYVYR
jgi:hypothetical protein